MSLIEVEYEILRVTLERAGKRVIVALRAEEVPATGQKMSWGSGAAWTVVAREVIR